MQMELLRQPKTYRPSIFFACGSSGSNYRPLRALLSGPFVSGRAMILGILATAFSQWNRHRTPRLGAALAYYSVFSMGPLLLLVTAVAGLFFDTEAVRGSLSAQFRSLVGPVGGAALESMLAGATFQSTGIVAAAFGIVLILIGAVGVVAQLKDAMNTIWNVEDPTAISIWWYVRTYLLSFAGVLALGLLLTVSLVISAGLAAISNRLGSGIETSTLWPLLDFSLSLAILTLLFAMLFKWFPDTKVAWRDVWLGGLVTALLFNIGKWLIGWYVGQQGLETIYGAAASIIVVLIWAYYSAQIVLIGAELTHAYSTVTGSRRQKGANATLPRKNESPASAERHGDP